MYTHANDEHRSLPWRCRLVKWMVFRPMVGFVRCRPKLEDTHFLPFYYHYFTTETKALISLLFQIALYFPVGAGIWLWRWAGGRCGRSQSGFRTRIRRTRAALWMAGACRWSAREHHRSGQAFHSCPASRPDQYTDRGRAAMLASWLLYLLLDVR